MSVSLLLFAATLTVDFGEEVAKLRPELHSSGFGPTICSRSASDMADIRSMGFKEARTHDWALVNPNQRVCDMHHMFPLMHLDATKSENYVFGPTDHLFKLVREKLGHEIFFRFGTSIEHSGTNHFNACIPEDFDKVAEIFAATVRHYNRGWANGYDWGIKYWEIWNEPDGINNMWCLPGGDENWVIKTDEDRAKFKIRSEKFAEMFVKCLKRVKGEFGDTVKVGGPALCEWIAIGGHHAVEFLKVTLDRCKTEGIAPDFISWHHYTDDTDIVMRSIADARKLCDSYGFKDCELIINEWHYFGYSQYDWRDLASPLAWEGPASHGGIDSAAFTAALLARFQTSELDRAHYYGCRSSGNWGFRDQQGNKYKSFYALQIIGEIVNGYQSVCRGSEIDPDGPELLKAFPVKSADGKKALLLVDYLGKAWRHKVEVKGVAKDAKVTAEVLDFRRSRVPVDVKFEDGVLNLRKWGSGSSLFFVKFEHCYPMSEMP